MGAERCAQSGFSVLTQRFASTLEVGKSLRCLCLWGRGELELGGGGRTERWGDTVLASEPQGLLGGAKRSTDSLCYR